MSINVCVVIALEAVEPYRSAHALQLLAPQDNQLMSKRGVLSFKPQLRLEWRGQDGQDEIPPA
jgi:hypothetical protein